MAKVQEGVRVEIYDQEYHVRGDLDPEYLKKLAKYLDAKMRSIAGHTHTVDSLRVAVLAALNITDEYHQLRTKYDAATKGLDQRIDQCTEVLDQILKKAV